MRPLTPDERIAGLDILKKAGRSWAQIARDIGAPSGDLVKKIYDRRSEQSQWLEPLDGYLWSEVFGPGGKAPLSIRPDRPSVGVFREQTPKESQTTHDHGLSIEPDEASNPWLWVHSAHKEGRGDLAERLEEIQDQKAAILEEWNAAKAEETAILAQLKNIYLSRARRDSGAQPKSVDTPKRGEPFSS